MTRTKISYLRKKQDELFREERLIRHHFKNLEKNINFSKASTNQLLSLRLIALPKVRIELMERYPLLHFPSSGEAELLLIEHSGGLSLKQGLSNEKMKKTLYFLSEEREIRLISLATNIDEKIMMKDNIISFLGKTYPCIDSLLEDVSVAFSQTAFNDTTDKEAAKEIGLVNLNLYHLLTGLGAY